MTFYVSNNNIYLWYDILVGIFPGEMDANKSSEIMIDTTNTAHTTDTAISLYWTDTIQGYNW